MAVAARGAKRGEDVAADALPRDGNGGRSQFFLGGGLLVVASMHLPYAFSWERHHLGGADKGGPVPVGGEA